jgi:hypothetical protein
MIPDAFAPARAAASPNKSARMPGPSGLHRPRDMHAQFTIRPHHIEVVSGKDNQRFVRSRIPAVAVRFPWRSGQCW